MTFGAAFNKLRTRCMQEGISPKMYRKSWSKGMYVKIYIPCLHPPDGFVVTNSFLYKENRDGKSTYLPDNDDLFARDWEIVE